MRPHFSGMTSLKRRSLMISIDRGAEVLVVIAIKEFVMGICIFFSSSKHDGGRLEAVTYLTCSRCALPTYSISNLLSETSLPYSYSHGDAHLLKLG